MEICARLRAFPKQIGPVAIVLGGLISLIKRIPPALEVKRFQAAKPPLQWRVAGHACRLPMREGFTYRLPILIPSHRGILFFERWRGKLKPTRARDNSDLPFLPGDRAAG